jgi:hypothetical protein
LAHDLRWERAERSELPSAVIAAADRVSDRQSYRRGQLIHYLRLYGDRAIQGWVGSSAAGYPTARRTLGSGPTDGRRLSLNVVRNMVDAATSKLVKGRPRPQNLTSAGDYTLQRVAELRDKFIEGHFHAGDFWQLRQRCIKNMALLGTGVMYVLEHWGQVRYEYVFPGEVLVDDAEGIYGEPRNLYRQRCVDRTVLMERYPRARAAIENAAPADNRYFGRDQQSDQVLVTQAWHLPSGPKANDGRACAVVDGEVLYESKWKRESFPFLFWRWSDEPLGFWGVGLAEQLSGIQLEINQLLRMIQNNMYLGGNIKVMIERGSRVVDAQISNALRGVLVEYTGTPPQFHVHDVITNQVIQHLQTLIQSAYEISGISQLSASGQLPANMAGSGRAQLVYHNIESERFITVGRNDERAVMQAGEQTLECARDILKRDGSYKVFYHDKNWIEEVDAKEALQEVGTFEMTVTPASQLPHDYAGRVAFAEQMEARGWLDQDEAIDVADLPDIKRLSKMKLSSQKLIDKAIEMVLERGEYIPPIPRMNLQMAIQRATNAFVHAYLQKYPPERLDLLNDWIEQCQDQLQAATEPAPGASALPAESSEAAPIVSPDAAPGAPIPPEALPPPQGPLN